MKNEILLFTGLSFDEFSRGAGAYRIATELRKNGYEVQVIDMYPILSKVGLYLIEKIIDKYVTKNTLWVGFSTTFFALNRDNHKAKNLHKRDFIENGLMFSYEEALSLKNKITSRSPGCKIVIGGNNSNRYDFLGIVDVYVQGYADTTVVEISQWMQGKNHFIPLVKNPDGSVSVTHDIKGDRFNFNSSEIIFTKQDHIFDKEALPIEISRGCLFSCTFCHHPLLGKKKLDYIRDAEKIREELIRNYEMFGTTTYMFADDTFNDSVEKLEILYNHVFSKLPFKIQFHCYCRLDLIAAHPESIELLENIGLGGIFFGVESLNYESAKFVGKGIKTEKAIDTLHLLHERWKNKINITVSGIVGLPHETEKSVTEWLDYLSSPTAPLDTLLVFPLFIHRENHHIWQSDFEQNFEKYGYSWTESDGWLSPTSMTESIANSISAQYMARSEQNGKFKINSWAIPGFMNLGFEKDYLLQVSKKQLIETTDMRERKRNLVRSYLGKIL
jgi:radical SAM superfamily enzyme YgiQ (UPF0313 family)